MDRVTCFVILFARTKNSEVIRGAAHFKPMFISICSVFLFFFCVSRALHFHKIVCKNTPKLNLAPIAGDLV